MKPLTSARHHPVDTKSMARIFCLHASLLPTRSLLLPLRSNPPPRRCRGCLRLLCSFFVALVLLLFSVFVCPELVMAIGLVVPYVVRIGHSYLKQV